MAPISTLLQTSATLLLLLSSTSASPTQMSAHKSIDSSLIPHDPAERSSTIVKGPTKPPWMHPGRHGIAPPANGTLWRCDTNPKSPTYKNVLKAADVFENMLGGGAKREKRVCKRDPYNPRSMHFTGSYEQMLDGDGVHVYIHGYMGHDYCSQVATQLRQLARACMFNFPMGDAVERVGGAIFYMNNPRTYTWISVTQKPLDWYAPG